MSARINDELAPTYEALTAERDALAVENAALKSSVDLIATAYTEGEPAGFEIDRARNIETPATDAALAAIEARGVEKAIAHLLNKFEGTGQIGWPVMALESLAKQMQEAK
ncbi:Uncharacterised protein [Serratia quinivorans]|uniref:hypothetical protein n=1 Tax=Serratia quinivorans TaxID=137545 RepID=UPI00217BC324|nr:hypothetical protein [Serratia quinivorans]CAI1818054.1 Uncharacterised protein [Serratia quinivorans]